MNIIGCLDVPTEGTYLLDGKDVGKMSRRELASIRNEKLGFIFQQYNLLPKLNLMENVEVPLVYAGISRAERHIRAREVLEQVGLGDKLKNRPNQLSGGQQQRVALARALVLEPGVLLFDETCISGSGNLGYLVADGERVSAGTAVAELYTDANQAVLRQQLTQLTSQIDLLQRSQNTAATQLDGLLKERSGALYDLLDALDTAQYSDVDESTDAYLLAQNKLWITTGDTAGFADQIALLAQQAQTVQAQLGNPTQIAAPTTGYFVRAASSGRLNAGAADILAQSPEQLKAYLDSDPEMPLDGCVGKLVAGFSWQYAGVCSAKQAEKLLGADGKPLRTAVEISFPGQSDAALRATVAEVTIDAEQDIARFVLQCNSINGDVLCLNHARARISTGESTGLRVPAAAVHYLKEDGTEAETQGENYIPGVYVKYGNIARFCKIDPVDADHPLISEDDYILVLPKGTDGSVSQVRLYDEIIVSGQNLYDGKLL